MKKSISLNNELSSTSLTS